MKKKSKSSKHQAQVRNSKRESAMERVKGKVFKEDSALNLSTLQ
jgi:hypothetical protein